MRQTFALSLLIMLPLMALSCSTQEDEAIKSGDDSPVILPTDNPSAVIDENAFSLLNLDYPGLEKVKEWKDKGNNYYAAVELLKYYRERSNVFNPKVDLINPTLTANEKNIADQALKYRFYINNYFYESQGADGLYVYYSFANNGAINWEYIPSGVTDQEFRYQKHRLNWMEYQAKAYRVTKDENYVKSIISVYSDWLKTYPCPVGTTFPSSEGNDVNYQWKGLQTSTRVMSQSDILPYIVQSGNFTPEYLTSWLTAYAQSVECIRANYYSDSNILISQAQAVATAGMLMPEFKNAETWRKEGCDKLSAQLDAQFLADGVQYELDPSYHIAAISDFREIYELASANSYLSLLPTVFLDKLRGAAQFVMDMIFPDYSLDNFNDTRNSSYSKNVLIKNLKQYSGMFPDNSNLKWMATQGAQGTAPSYLTKTYSTSGYYMLRNGWNAKSTMMILKNNYNPENKWHCQPDNGTFAIWSNGRNFFPDAGVYSYSTDANRATYRATKNHNTLTILSATLDATHQRGKLISLATTGNTDKLVTENNPKDGITHRRTVWFVDKKYFVIADEAYGSGNDKVNLNFHMTTSESNPTAFEDFSSSFSGGLHTTFEDGNNMALVSFSESHTDFSLAQTASDVSSSLGAVTGHRVGFQLTARKPIGANARFITVIYPIKDAVPAISASFGQNSIKVSIGSDNIDLPFTPAAN